ncbi:990_t:CDS:2, partial [Racocetra persica]
YEGISNFENNLYENISDGNIIDNENVTNNEDSDHTEDEKNKTTRSLPIISYFTPCEAHRKRVTLPEKQQNRIAYQLVAWIVEEMMPLNCINHDR